MSKQESQICKILVVTIFTLIAIILLIFGNYKHKINIAQSSVHSELLDKNVAKSKIYAKKDRALRKVFGNQLHSKDSIIRSGAINYHDNNEIFTPIQQFFSVFYTFNSTASYVNRANKLKNITSPYILNNKKYFNNGKDKTGGNYIDNIGEHSQFKNANITILNYNHRNLKAIVGVQYTGWLTGYTHEIGERWYLVVYDTEAKQIVKLEPLYRTSNINDNQL